MIDFLAGVPGKLKTIGDYLTTNLSTGRAAKIDNLDATVSTRAVASTAVSNADYTSGRAAKLDYLDAAISGRLSTCITSIQQVNMVCSAGGGSAAISSVNTAKAVCIYQGSWGTGVTTGAAILSSATLVSAFIESPSGAGYVRAVVVEFK